MARLIDAELMLDDMKAELEKASEENLTSDEAKVIMTSAIALKDFVTRQPTVDAVEVVRCKDCMFSDCKQSFRENETYCTISCLLVGNNEYCSSGATMDGVRSNE